MVRPEQHTLISVFKLNSCKFCQFKSQRMWAREKICACAHSKPANIKLSLKDCVWMDKFTQKLYKKARLGKCHSRQSHLNKQYQFILLKWQHFLNINQTATTKKSLNALDLIAFVALIKIHLSFIKSNIQCCFTVDYFIEFLYLRTNAKDLPKKKITVLSL